MRRVLVIGSPGAGKTTLARQMGQITGLPVVHLDRLFWQPGWKEPEQTAWRAAVEKALQADSWIIDGHYGSTLDLRLGAADTVILLDFPTLLCLRRAVGRALKMWGRTRPDMGPGCNERLDSEFLAYIFGFRRRKIPEIRAKLLKFPGLAVVLERPEEVRKFLATCCRASGIADAL